MEAYTYLLFQRTMIKVSLLFSILILLIGLPMSNNDIREQEFTFMWINEYDYDSFAFFHLSMLFYVICIYLYNIIRLRNRVQDVFDNIYIHNKCPWMLKTLHVSGLDKKDLNGLGLLNVIRSCLQESSLLDASDITIENPKHKANQLLVDGYVVNFLIINDMADLTALEIDKIEFEFLSKVYTKQPHLKKLLLPKKFNTSLSAEEDL